MVCGDPPPGKEIFSILAGSEPRQRGAELQKNPYVFKHYKGQLYKIIPVFALFAKPEET
jgi:hypothetical protein